MSLNIALAFQTKAVLGFMSPSLMKIEALLRLMTGKNWRLVISSLKGRMRLHKIIYRSLKARNPLIFILFIIFYTIFAVPNVFSQDFSQGYIESRIDSLFLADEKISFNIRVRNPTREILDVRLFVEIVGPDYNEEIFKERLYLYPGDLYLKSLDDRLASGDYKIRIGLKDKFFETVYDQKILEFKVVRSCNIDNICSYEKAYEKCERCVSKADPFDSFVPVFFGIIIFGIILVIYFETKRRNALG